MLVSMWLWWLVVLALAGSIAIVKRLVEVSFKTPAKPCNLTTYARQLLKHQVFISHTGQDSEAKTFSASVLGHQLRSHGLKTYIDYDNLKLAEKWRDELMDNAANSKVMVVVLSKSYTSRFWCMLELDLALHSHEQQGSDKQPVVIPVLFDSPEEVVQPRIIEDFWSSHEKVRKMLHEEEELKEEIWQQLVDPKRWARNIEYVHGQLQSLRRKQQHQCPPKDQERLMAEVVAKRAQEVMPEIMEVNATGLGARVEKLVKVLSGGVVDGVPDNGSCETGRRKALDARQGVWLYGCGGRGKTTMAKFLWNYHCSMFISRVFVSISITDGDNNIQSLLVRALKGLGCGDGCESLGVDTLKSNLRNAVKERDVLYILDNVRTAKQLEALLPPAWGKGSVVVITSRQQGFPVHDTNLQGWIAANTTMHEVELLGHEDSIELFRRSAGLGDAHLSASKDILEIEEKMLKICNGLPLALRVTGGSLWWRGFTQQADKRTENKRWKDALDALQKGNQDDPDLQGIVSYSLDQMKPPRREMFLDVVTLLLGEDATFAKATWTSLHPHATVGDCFRDLQAACLLDTDQHGKLVVHDIIVTLGRNLAAQDPHSSRVWMEGSQVESSWEVRQQPIVGVSLDMSVCQGACEAPEPDLPKAGILRVTDVVVNAQKAVAWLELCTTFKQDPSQSIVPPDMVAWLNKAKSLAVIKVYGEVKDGDLREVNCSRFSKLQHLQFSDGNVKHLPDNLGDAANLRSIVVTNSFITSVPESVGHLQDLEHLDLHACAGIRELPETTGNLQKCKLLDLYWCYSLAKLPESLGQMVALTKLDLSHCTSLGCLPDSLEKLTALVGLNVSGCSRLEGLPGNIGRLPCCQQLNLSGCISLKELPASLGQMSALIKLDLSGCSNLQELPQFSCQMLKLVDLNLKKCSKLRALPETIGQLPGLTKLRLECCSSLKTLPDSLGQLTGLSELLLAGSCSLEGLPESVGQLVAVTRINLVGCTSLCCLPHSLKELKELTALVNLNLSDCTILCCLPDSLAELGALVHLNLAGCSRLEGLPDKIGQLRLCQELDLYGCISLKELPASLGQMAALTKLDLSGCSSLQELPQSLDQLAALTYLGLSECQGLQDLPDMLGQLAALNTLSLSGCTKLQALPITFSQLAGLRLLDLSECISLQPMPQCLSQLSAFHCAEVRSRGLPQGYGWMRRPEDRRVFCMAAAPTGHFIREWRVGCDSTGIVCIQGVTNDGNELPILGQVSLEDLPTDAITTVVQESSMKVHGRARRWWLNAFMGQGSETEGAEWCFSIPQGHRITGYGGFAGEHVGFIHFQSAAFGDAVQEG